MSVRRNEPEDDPNSPQRQPLISLKALVIICVAVAGVIAAAMHPGWAIPILVGVAIAGLLVQLVGD